MSDRAVDDLNARLVQQRTAFEDKQVNTRTIPAFLALSLFKNHRLCHCPSDCLSSPARRDVVHDRGRSRHQVPRTRGPRPKPPATQVGARPRRRRGRERAQASTEARGALLRRGTPPRLQITHFSVDTRPFAHLALLRAASAKKQEARQLLERVRDHARDLQIADVRVLGPVSAPMERRAGRYRAQLLLQSRDRRCLQGGAAMD